MNDYMLPRWYTKCWELICIFQHERDEAAIGHHVGIRYYLLGLALVKVIDEVGYNNLLSILVEVSK